MPTKRELQRYVKGWSQVAKEVAAFELCPIIERQKLNNAAAMLRNSAEDLLKILDQHDLLQVALAKEDISVGSDLGPWDASGRTYLLNLISSALIIGGRVIVNPIITAEKRRRAATAREAKRATSFRIDVAILELATEIRVRDRIAQRSYGNTAKKIQEPLRSRGFDLGTSAIEKRLRRVLPLRTAE